jgi:steroid 5-alpha reductase family enzyme
LDAILLANLVAIAALILLAWLISLPLANASIMDIFWGLGFVATAWVSLLLADDVQARAWLAAALTTIWGLRLAGYLLWRSPGKPEERRYCAFENLLQDQSTDLGILSFEFYRKRNKFGPCGDEHRLLSFGFSPASMRNFFWSW